MHARSYKPRTRVTGSARCWRRCRRAVPSASRRAHRWGSTTSGRTRLGRKSRWWWPAATGTGCRSRCIRRGTCPRVRSLVQIKGTVPALVAGNPAPFMNPEPPVLLAEVCSEGNAVLLLGTGPANRGHRRNRCAVRREPRPVGGAGRVARRRNMPRLFLPDNAETPREIAWRSRGVIVRRLLRIEVVRSMRSVLLRRLSRVLSRYRCISLPCQSADLRVPGAGGWRRSRTAGRAKQERQCQGEEQATAWRDGKEIRPHPPECTPRGRGGTVERGST